MLYFFENIILCLVVVSSLFVLIVSNPVQSLLWLILTFALSSMLFMFVGAELMSIIIFMVYIGAIAILFLFVIMMLNIKIIELRFFYLHYFPIGIIVISFLILEILLSILFEFNINSYNELNYELWFNLLNLKGNLFLIGSIIYNFNFVLFFLLGIVLFVAMICSIILLVNWDNQYKIKNNYGKSFYFFLDKKILFLK